jgi:SpoVK/Ycf46/Vps4 family AAA+-type ATPase
LDAVVGHDAAKEWLANDAKLIAQGKVDALPMGYLLCGPVGTGKTFLATCYTGSIGIPCVKLLNFRSQWQGVTEGNWEKILTVLKATGPVGVIIDEADAAVGDRSASGDSGTSSRVFAKLASTMGDTAFRGHILWFLLTCRPDLLPVDLKRQGRAEVHIPLFYPEDGDERLAMFSAMAKKTGTKLGKDALTDEAARHEFSGADVEAVVVRAKRRAYLADRTTVSAKDLKAELESFVPAIRGDEMELMEIAAVLESTNTAFLPERYRTRERKELHEKFNQLKRRLD